MLYRINGLNRTHHCRHSSGPAIALLIGMYEELKRRWNMSPLLLVMLLTLLPFPVLLVVLVLADRWRKPNHQATS